MPRAALFIVVFQVYANSFILKSNYIEFDEKPFFEVTRNYSLSPGVWQSFVTIRSCNHLMRIISTRLSTTQRKVRSREDDNYSNWVIINYGVYKGLYHISCLLQIIKPFIRPPQGLLFLVAKTF